MDLNLRGFVNPRWKLGAVWFLTSLPLVRTVSPPLSFSSPNSFLSFAAIRVGSTEARKHFVADRRAGLIRLECRQNFRIRGRVGRQRL